MAWVKRHDWLFTPIGSKVGGANNLMVVMWYDTSSVSLTEVKVKFSLTMKNNLGQVDYYDTFYLLFNPGKEASSTPSHTKMWRYGLKTKWTDGVSGASKYWPYDPGTIYTLEKNELDKKFYLPPFWICNRGRYGENKDANDIYYVMTHNTIGKDYYDPIEASEWEIEPDESIATEGSAPSLIVSYNKNNTFRLRTTLGKEGTNNSFKEAHLFYTLDGTDPASSSTRKEVSLKGCKAGSTFTTDPAISKRMEKGKIQAYVVCEFDYNTQIAKAENKEAFPYYQAPTPPSNIKLVYKKGRLTIKEPWTFTWTAATSSNNDSPVNGYRVRLIKNGVSLTGLAAGSGNTVIKGTGLLNYLDRGTSTELTLDPVSFDFKAGDTVRLGLYSYTEDGAKNKLFNGGGSSDKQVLSEARTVQNAGIMRVKVGTEWKEGQVYVKVGNEWKEAETVNVKTSAGWKESE